MKSIHTIGLVAHVDAGKTTTTEQIMYISKEIRSLGDVNKGSSMMDYNEIEKRRGITVFSEQATIKWKDHIINIIDTPGHIDFSTELERSLKVLDGAVLIISAVEGVQSHTETIWKLLRKYNIPTLIFVNKLDRVGARSYKVYKDIEENITKDILPLQNAINVEKGFNGFLDVLNDKLYTWNSNNPFDFSIKEEMEISKKNMIIEKLAEKDDYILEKYLQDEIIEKSEINKSIKEQFSNCSIFPVLLGSSMKGIGMFNILNSIVGFLKSKEEKQNEKFSSFIYKVKFDEIMGKLCYIKVLSGDLKVRDIVFNENGEEEKVTQIRKYNGEKYTTIEKITSGEIGVVCGIKNVHLGEYLGEKSKKVMDKNYLKAVLISKVIPKNEEETSNVLKALKILNEEDPSLKIMWNDERRELSINTMGLIHIEVLKGVIKDRFNLDVELEKPKVNYIETITKKSVGFCHFEPKKHYAEVEFEIEPNKRDKGIEYTSNVSLDILPIQYQNNIKKAVYEGIKHGTLIGSEVTDIKIKLISAKYHLEHTHGGDFRIATIRAIHKALMDNKSILLEPLYKYKIVVDKSFSGKVMSDILKMNGSFNEPIVQNNKICIIGEVPISKSMYYKIELASATSGKAMVNMQFSRYEVCHNEKEVLENMKNTVSIDETLYNGISLFREKKKMKKVNL